MKRTRFFLLLLAVLLMLCVTAAAEETAQLDAPQNLAWNDMVLSWDPVYGPDGGMVYYSYELLYSADVPGEDVQMIPGVFWRPETRAYLNAEDLAFGAGYYSFRVMAKDLASQSVSEWTEYGQWIYLDPQPAAAPVEPRWDGGVMTWTAVEYEGIVSYEYQIFYHGLTGEETPVLKGSGYAFIANDPTPTQAPNEALLDEEGCYTFQVRTRGGGTKLSSAWVESINSLYYRQPPQLPAPTNARWEDGRCAWDAPEVMPEGFAAYAVRIYWAETEAGLANAASVYSFSSKTSPTEMVQTAFIFKGEGYYKFSVCSDSDDLSLARDSELCWSDVFHLTGYEKLPTPTDFALDEKTMTLSWSMDEVWNDRISAFSIAVYYAAEQSGAQELIGVCGQVDTSKRSRQVDINIMKHHGEGWYFFVLTAGGKGLETQQSDASEPLAYYYTVPEATLDAPTGAAWDGDAMTWDMLEALPESAAGYRYEVLWGEQASYLNESGLFGTTVVYGGTVPADGRFPQLDRALLEKFGAEGGYVRFRVQARSGDETQIASSPWCVSEIIPYTEAQPIAFAGTSMTLGNDLTMNFYVKQADVTGEGWYAEILRSGQTLTVPMSQWTKSGSMYRISYAGIAAKEMTDMVEVVIYDADGNAVSQVYTDSVRAYAMRMFGQGMDTLLVDMLNYGAAAQEQFGYKTGDPANSLLSEAQKALATESVEMNDHRVQGANYYGSSLALETNIELVFYFTNVTADMTAEIRFTHHTGDTVVKVKDIVMNGSYGQVVVDQLVVADAGQPVTVTVTDAAGNVVASATDSVESYCARMDALALREPLMKFARSAYDQFH